MNKIIHQSDSEIRSTTQQNPEVSFFAGVLYPKNIPYGSAVRKPMSFPKIITSAESFEIFVASSATLHPSSRAAPPGAKIVRICNGSQKTIKSHATYKTITSRAIHAGCTRCNILRPLLWRLGDCAPAIQVSHRVQSAFVWANKDPVKMTGSGMAPVKRGLGTKHAHANCSQWR